MYNEDRKKRYRNYRTQSVDFSQNYFNRLFNNSALFEEKYKKDLCDFSTPEIEDMLKTISYSSITSLDGDITQYAVYTDWCLSNGFVRDSQNHFREIDRNSLGRYLNKAVLEERFLTRKEIESWCAKLDNACDAVVLLGMFEGIGGKNYVEFTYLHRSNIHVNENKIDTCLRKNLDVSLKLKELMFESADTDVYHMRYRDIKFQPSDLVIKEVPQAKNVSDAQKSRRIYQRFMRAAARIDGEGKLNTKAIKDSGVIWFAQERAKYYGMTLNEYVDDNTRFQEINARYGKNINRTLFKITYKDFLSGEKSV